MTAAVWPQHGATVWWAGSARSAERCCVGWSFHQVHHERMSSTPTEIAGSLSPMEMASVVVRPRTLF